MRARKGYADGPFGQVHCQWLGDGVPLLLLHQSPSSSEMFAAVYPLLAASGIRAIGIDSPGFGQSDPPSGTPTIAGRRGWDGFKAAFDYDVASALRDLRQQCLILTNTGDDLYAASCRAHRLRPDFAFVELPGGTHDIVDEQPEPWAAAVAAFLR
jgi:pimeloyl-ACP methyl ester carboxylesterase